MKKTEATPMPPILADLRRLIVDSFLRASRHPLDEIRGHVTRDLVRDWLLGLPDVGHAVRCALLLDRGRMQLTAMLVDADGAPVYSDDGLRLANVFIARSIEREFERLFERSALIFVPLDKRS